MNTSGILATITFEALADGFCELGLYDVILSTPPEPDPETIPTNVTNGSVRIGLCGDCNIGQEGDVNILDVFAIYNNYTAAHEPVRSLWAADCNPGQKGTIDILDVFAVYNNYTAAHEPLNCRCQPD